MQNSSLDTDRFLEAQASVYTQVLEELRSGHKRSHWMWFIFPQLDGLGTSARSRRYAIKTLADAREYLAHPLLGARITECTEVVNSCGVRNVREIFGAPDDLKFHSSMTLFALASKPMSQFESALASFFDGKRDARTVELAHSTRSQNP